MQYLAYLDMRGLSVSVTGGLMPDSRVERVLVGSPPHGVRVPVERVPVLPFRATDPCPEVRAPAPAASAGLPRWHGQADGAFTGFARRTEHEPHQSEREAALMCPRVLALSEPVIRQTTTFPASPSHVSVLAVHLTHGARTAIKPPPDVVGWPTW
jgi:hypothetical protein